MRNGRTARFAVLIGLALVGMPSTALAEEAANVPTTDAVRTSVIQDAEQESSSQPSFSQDALSAAANDVEESKAASGASVAANTAKETSSKSAEASGQKTSSASVTENAGDSSVPVAGNEAETAAGKADEEGETEEASSTQTEKASSNQLTADSTTSGTNVAGGEASESKPQITVMVDVDGKGEMSASYGQIAGTVGEGRLIDLVTVDFGSSGTSDEVASADLEYRAHIQDDGWGSWTAAGNAVGKTGSGKGIEALQFRLRSGSAFANDWEVWIRARVENEGWLAWTNDGPIGSIGKGMRLEALEIRLERKPTAASNDSAANSDIEEDFSSDEEYPFIDGTQVVIQAHVQDIGWQDWVSNGKTAGTEHKCKRVEAIRFKVDNAYLDGDIEAQAHVEDIGWQGWKASGSLAGTTGQGKRIEAIEFRLAGDLANYYDAWYRANVQDIGWMGWTKNGSPAGTTGVAGRMEAMQGVLLKKGSDAPTSANQSTTLTFVTAPQIEYSAYVQDIGWQHKVSGNEVAGTTGQAKQIETITMDLPEGDNSCPGGVEYRAHIQYAGWLDWVADGEEAGTTGQARRLEAFQAKLTGEIAKFFDICYQAHVQNIGWQQWVKNGEVAGTTGKSLPVEAYRIKIVLKAYDVPDAGVGYCWLAESPYWSGSVKQRIMNVHYSTGRYDEDTEVQHYIKQIVIHHNAGTLTTEGCYQTWQNRAASAHYQVETDGTVGQLVYDSNTAWHAGNWQENLDSIGVEHADAQGSTSSNWHLTEATINAGAKLVALLCMKYSLVRPQWGVNVVGHGDVSRTDHRDVQFLVIFLVTSY